MKQAIKVESKIEFLASEIQKHKDNYYNSTPHISDAAFDRLEDELRLLAPEHPILHAVGAPTVSEWKKAKHIIPMGSLDKVKTPEKMSEWIHDALKNHNTLFVTEKLDGLSIEVIYSNGELKQAITRGDGVEGDDITPNILCMSGIKGKLPLSFSGSIRGEIILKKSVFAADEFFAEYANTRNAAAGISKRLDGIGCKHLTVLFYQAIGSVDSKPTLFKHEFTQLGFISKDLGLLTPSYHVFTHHDLNAYAEATSSLWKQYQDSLRDKLDWDIDGLVVRVNELDDQLLLGDLHMKPKGAMAFKFTEEQAVSTVTAILLQVGNSGRVTPVLEVEPVRLVGVQVNRASLYNFAYIRKLGIDVGAKVIIVRANDVIPRCESVVDPVKTVFQPPTECPVCGGRVEMIGENLQCLEADTCPAQIVGRLKNWINTLNIMEWGGKLLARLVEFELVSNIADLYSLSIDDLMNLERMGEKSATKCYEILWSHNPIPLDLFVGGLSIPMVGTSTIQMLIAHGMTTLDSLLKASCEDFKAVKGLGPIRAKSLFEGLKHNKEIIQAILKAGIKIQANEPKIATTGSLNGMSICITGSTEIKRSDLIDIIGEHGGVFKESVSKGCTHLMIADPNKKSKKTDNALKLGIKMISEQDLFDMIKS